MTSKLPPEFERVVLENHASLRFFIRSLGVLPGWVDDIAQESVLLLLKKWDHLERHDELDSWLRSAARNLVRNELRIRSRRPRLLNTYLTSLVLDQSTLAPDPATYTMGLENQSILRRCLAALTGRTRCIVEQRYFEDRNSTEIAKQLQMKASTVRRTLLKAREALAACISREESNPSEA